MTSIEYPADVIRELSALRRDAERGVQILADAERKAVELELNLNKQESTIFITAKGSVADRTAIAKIKTAELRLEAEIARIEVNRIKLRLKQITEAQMNVQTQARMVELQWKTAGIGER